MMPLSVPCHHGTQGRKGEAEPQCSVSLSQMRTTNFVFFFFLTWEIPVRGDLLLVLLRAVEVVRVR